MRGWYLCLWLWWLALGSAAAQTLPGELAIAAEDRYALGPGFMYLEDKSGQLTLDEILAPPSQAAFQPVARAGSGTNFGLTQSAIWLRVKLRTSIDAPADWLLEIAYPPLNRLDLYSPGAAAGAGFEHQLAGNLQPYASRVIPHRNHVLPVQLKPGTENTLYLRIESQGTVSAPATLWQPAALWQHDQANYATLSLYFGLLAGLLLYNALLFISVRDIGYLIYVAFVASTGMGQASLTGLGAQFLWPQWTWWNIVSSPVGLGAGAAFGLLFARNFLSSSVRMPRVDRFLVAQFAGWMLAIVAGLTLPYRVSFWMVTVMAIVSTATMVLMGVISIRRGFAGARYFFTAWALLLLGGITLTLHNNGVLPSNRITSNALLIGSALEMVLLSFALANRINVARRFKEQAHVRIAAERSMVQALSQSQEQLRTVLKEREIILDCSIAGIAFLTAEGRFRWANKSMLDIFGAESHANMSIEPFYLSRDQYLRIGKEVAANFARGETYEAELQMRRVDGAVVWVSLAGKAVNQLNPEEGTVWVSMDITPRKQLEEQLKKTTYEREAILNNALVGIVLSVARRHEWVNEKFAQMLGYPRQVLIGKSSDHLHPDDESWRRFGVEARAELIATGSYVCERQLKRRNGELFWVEMGGSCVRPNDPDSGVIWTFLEITERKKSETEIREALEQQKALNALRSRFVAMTSQEFRTPLAAILSAQELLRHHGDRLPQAERIEVLDRVASDVQRISRMVDRMMLLGKADAGTMEFEPRMLDLPLLCRQFVDEARVQQPGYRGEVALAFGAGIDEGVYDEKLLRHIFGNLLSNALKYSPAGGEVRFDVRREGGSTVFEVADRGIGIPPDEISHLFGSFHRASNVGAIPGSGLGLAIVKNAVEMHGGRIEVTSTVGQGTTFTVTLPA